MKILSNFLKKINRINKKKKTGKVCYMSVIEEFEEKIPTSSKLAFGGAQFSSNLIVKKECFGFVFNRVLIYHNISQYLKT